MFFLLLHMNFLIAKMIGRCRGNLTLCRRFSDIEMNHRYLVMAHVPSSKAAGFRVLLVTSDSVILPVGSKPSIVGDEAIVA